MGDSVQRGTAAAAAARGPDPDSPAHLLCPSGPQGSVPGGTSGRAQSGRYLQAHDAGRRLRESLREEHILALDFASTIHKHVLSAQQVRRRVGAGGRVRRATKAKGLGCSLCARRIGRAAAGSAARRPPPCLPVKSRQSPTHSLTHTMPRSSPSIHRWPSS